MTKRDVDEWEMDPDVGIIGRRSPLGLGKRQRVLPGEAVGCDVELPFSSPPVPLNARRIRAILGRGFLGTRFANMPVVGEAPAILTTPAIDDPATGRLPSAEGPWLNVPNMSLRCRDFEGRQIKKNSSRVSYQGLSLTGDATELSRMQWLSNHPALTRGNSGCHF